VREPDLGVDLEQAGFLGGCGGVGADAEVGGGEHQQPGVTGRVGGGGQQQQPGGGGQALGPLPEALLDPVRDGYCVG
jgi:hypothetical protein